MKTKFLVGVILFVALACMGVASACEYGCTPGYWKSPKVLAAGWPCLNPNGIIPENIDLNGDGKMDTYLDALRYTGGSGDSGAERILLRAGVASYLNECATGGSFSATPANWNNFFSLLSGPAGKRNSMISLAAIFDRYNNGVCPIPSTWVM
jgi:hypothetical protein